MKAILVKQPGGADQLQLGEHPKPDPKENELLIKVEAAAINRTDIINRESSSGYLDHQILGVEVSGVVEKSVPEGFLTSYQTLVWIGNLRAEETVLIHAGGSGVGTAAIQLAKQIGKANVITTAGSQEKLDFAKKLGADYCINYKKQEFDEEV